MTHTPSPTKLYAVELDFCGHRRVTTGRYSTRREARQACDRHAPLFRPRIVVVRAAQALQPLGAP